MSSHLFVEGALHEGHRLGALRLVIRLPISTSQAAREGSGVRRSGRRDAGAHIFDAVWRISIARSTSSPSGSRGERDAFRRGFRHLGVLDLSIGSLEADLVNQSVERLNEEIRQGTDLVGIFLRDSLSRVPSGWRVGV